MHMLWGCLATVDLCGFFSIVLIIIFGILHKILMHWLSLPANLNCNAKQPIQLIPNILTTSQKVP